MWNRNGVIPCMKEKKEQLKVDTSNLKRIHKINFPCMALSVSFHRQTCLETQYFVKTSIILSFL